VGKQTLAKAIAESLVENIPFWTFNSSDMFSSERSKIENLKETFKHSVGLQIIEEIPILEAK
jgi:DNA helicase TIP49 (TBP-interacting protein)